MKWIEKRFVSRSEVVGVLDQLSPKKKSSEQLAEIVFKVREFRQGENAVKPTARAIDSAMLRSFRVPGVNTELQKISKKDGKKKRILIYSKKSG